MIKRIINGLAIGLIILTSILWYLSSRKEISTDLKIYTILTNYSILFHEDKTFSVQVYLNDKNNILKYEDDNSFTLGNSDFSNSILLYTNSVSVTNTTKYGDDKFYCYSLSFYLPTVTSDFILEKCYLKIENTKYETKLFLGSFYMHYLDEYELFDYSALYGSYSVDTSYKNLVGINIAITNSNSLYYINKVTSADFISCDLSNVIMDGEIANEIEISDVVEDYNDYQSNNEILAVSKDEHSYFIPVHILNGYYTSSTFLEITIGSKTYIVDNFTYKGSSIELEDYSEICQKGKIDYASV